MVVIPAEAGIQKNRDWMPHQVRHDMPTKSKEALDPLHLVWCLNNDFTIGVIPGLTRNPVFSIWIPAGVYPDGNRGGNENSWIVVKKR